MNEPTQPSFSVTVRFFSYFQDLTGCAEVAHDVAPGTTLGILLDQLRSRFPKLVPMRNSTLSAVGVEYQDRSYILKPGDEVSLFPPVQGG